MTAVRNEKSGAMMLSVFAVCVVAHSVECDAASLALSQRLAPAANFAPAVIHPRPALTAQQMVAALRDGGLPISAIAEAARVERKTIYSWINGSAEVRGPNMHRLAQIHALMTGDADVEPRQIYRFWNSPVASQRTLRELITAENVDELVMRRALEGIRSAARSAATSERHMHVPGAGNPIEDEIPEVGIES